MKTLEQIKNRFALEKGYYDWLDLFLRLTEGEITQNQVTFMQYEEEMMKIYAMECLKLASENVICNENCININGIEVLNEFSVKQSITNEKNIIK